jgi:DNA-binding CsgD family transcriptional regulator
MNAARLLPARKSTSMDHFLVFFFLLVLMLGVWTAFAIRHHSVTYGTPIFRGLLRYLITFNLMVLGYLVAKYSYTNVLGDNPFQYPPLIVSAASLVVFAIESAVAWTVLDLGRHLRDTPPASNARRILLVALSLVGMSYAVGITILLQSGSLTWLVRTHLAMGLVMISVIVLVLVSVVAGRLPRLEEDRRNSARLLGGFLLLGYLAFAASVALPQSVQLVGSASALLWLNLAPWIWLRVRAQAYVRVPSPGCAADAISSLAIRYGITKREQEIIELIVQGKSNKEIEAALFISFSTVKNHAYNIYRKLGVKSRAQLMRLVMTAAQPPEVNTRSGDDPA